MFVHDEILYSVVYTYMIKYHIRTFGRDEMTFQMFLHDAMLSLISWAWWNAIFKCLYIIKCNIGTFVHDEMPYLHVWTSWKAILKCLYMMKCHTQMFDKIKWHIRIFYMIKFHIQMFVHDEILYSNVYT